MRAWAAALVVAGACDGIGVETPTDSHTGEPIETTPPEPTTEPTTEPTDTAEPPPTKPEEAALRVLHVAAELAPQDMVVNGNLPPVLNALAYADGTVYSDRPAGPYTFEFKDAGAALPDAWTAFNFDLVDDRRHSFVIFGTASTRAVLALVDDDLDIDDTTVRIRWTHAAPALPGLLDLHDLNTGAPIHLGLAYGSTVELDAEPVDTQLGLDADGDGNPDLVFESFERSSGEYFHVVIASDVTGVPYLLGHTEDGATPRRDLVIGG